MSFRQDSIEATEIVIGIVGPIGCNKALVIDSLKKLIQHHSYRTEVIGMSEVISQWISVPDTRNDQFLRVTNLMNAGNELRRSTQDNSILAKLAAEAISKRRTSQSDKRVIYIVDSIKHPEEVAELRNIYGAGFYLIAVYSSEAYRREFLRTDCRIKDATKRDQLINRDRDENTGHGQSTRDAFHMADFFLSENGNVKKTKNWLMRFLDLMFGDPFRTPTFNEFAMFMAYAGSTRSADLSRQVGAVITVNEEIVSVGANECPRAFGGTYWPEYDENTGAVIDVEHGRDFKRGEDPNAREREEIVRALQPGLSKQAVERLKSNIATSGLADITEYGRAVHAEMDAILACARRGISAMGANLYCTTYPCHNCAKHIVASGIVQVVFVEPYPKSKALHLHSEAIAPSDEKDGKKVSFKPFVGVGPRQFVNFFSMGLGSGSKLIRKAKPGFGSAKWDRDRSVPRVKMFQYSYLENESSAAKAALSSLKKSGKKTPIPKRRRVTDSGSKRP